MVLSAPAGKKGQPTSENPFPDKSDTLDISGNKSLVNAGVELTVGSNGTLVDLNINLDLGLLKPVGDLLDGLLNL